MNNNGDLYFSDIFSDCLAAYVSDYSSRTAKEYTGAVRALCAYLRKDFLEITPKDAGVFFDYMKKRVQCESLTVTTYNNRLYCYKNLALYIIANYPDIVFENPFLLIESIPYEISIKASRVPSLEEIDIMLSTCLENPMCYLIFSLAFRASLSSSDIVALKLSYIKQIDNCVTLVFPADASHKDVRKVALPEDVSVLLLNYVNAMSYTDSAGHLFYNKYGNPLTLRNLDALVKKLIQKSGISSKYTLKDFRTRAILDMVQASVGDEAALDKVSDYVNIGQLRLNQYINARYLAKNCPANLVNLRVVANDVVESDFD